MYNFKDIVYNVSGSKGTLYATKGNAFADTETRNYGGYISIKNGGTAISPSDTTTGSTLFTASINSGTVSKIGTLSLLDIKGSNNDSTDLNAITAATDRRKGLFKLNEYTPKPGTGYYWLASPDATNDYSLHVVDYYGYISPAVNDTFGARPVVSITGVKIKRDAGSHVWKIVN